ncbi:MAG: hypothetical protein ACRCWO_11350, partial [Bosea sp. (in: a-proteobacteria)]
MSFDLSEGSVSRQVLDQALMRRDMPTLAEIAAAQESAPASETLSAAGSAPSRFSGQDPAQFINNLLPPEASVIDPRAWAALPGKAKTYESLGIRAGAPQMDAGGLLLGGVNSTETIRAVETINGYPVSDLEQAMYPSTDAPADSPHKSISGFLGEGESLIERLAHDNDLVASYGLTHQQVAATMSYFIAMGDIYGGMRTRRTDGDTIMFNGRLFTVIRDNWGFQPSPFRDGTESRGDYEVVSLETGESIRVATLVRDMAERYGFYEGDTQYRVDPEIWIKFLGLDQAGGSGGTPSGDGPTGGRSSIANSESDSTGNTAGPYAQNGEAAYVPREVLITPSPGGFPGNQIIISNGETGQKAYIVNTRSGYAAVRLDSKDGKPAFDLNDTSVSEGMKMLPEAYDNRMDVARKLRESDAGAALTQALAASYADSLDAVKAVGAALRGFNNLASVENEIGVTLLTLRDGDTTRTVAVPEVIIGNFTSTMLPMIDISVFDPAQVVGVHRLHTHPAEGSILAWSQALLSDGDVNFARDAAEDDAEAFPNLEASAFYSVDGLTGGITRFMTDVTDPEWPELLVMIGDNLPARTGLGKDLVVATPALERSATIEPYEALKARGDISVQHKAWRTSHDEMMQQIETLNEVVFLQNQTRAPGAPLLQTIGVMSLPVQDSVYGLIEGRPVSAGNFSHLVDFLTVAYAEMQGVADLGAPLARLAQEVRLAATTDHPLPAKLRGQVAGVVDALAEIRTSEPDDSVAYFDAQLAEHEQRLAEIDQLINAPSEPPETDKSQQPLLLKAGNDRAPVVATAPPRPETLTAIAAPSQILGRGAENVVYAHPVDPALVVKTARPSMKETALEKAHAEKSYLQWLSNAGFPVLLPSEIVSIPEMASYGLVMPRVDGAFFSKELVRDKRMLTSAEWALLVEMHGQKMLEQL